jgi:hypothetical protein
MRKIAVISCAKSRKNYKCSVSEMYSDSKSFQARQIFMDEVYDEWYVSTIDLGFMKPEMEIEPYGNDWYIGPELSTLKVNNKSTPEMINGWLELLKIQFPNREDIELHCHTSTKYYTELQNIFPNIIHFKPQNSFITTAWKYLDATDMLLGGSSVDECLKFIQTPTPKSKPKEQKKWFYHVDGREYYGTSGPLAMKYKVDNGGMYRVSVGISQMLVGWVIDKDLLPYITRYPSGRYSLSKEVRIPQKPYNRSGLKEKLIELNKRKWYEESSSNIM